MASQKVGRININWKIFIWSGLIFIDLKEYSKFIDKSVGSIYNEFAINAVMSIFQGDEEVLSR